MYVKQVRSRCVCVFAFSRREKPQDVKILYFVICIYSLRISKRRTFVTNA